MVKKLKHIFYIFLCLFCAQAEAYSPEEGNINAVFGPVISRSMFTGTRTSTEPSTTTSFGLLAIGDVNRTGSLEIGLFYITKQFFREQNGLFYGEQTGTVHVDMGYRFWFGDIFSTSLSFFSAYTMGDIAVIHSDLPAGQTLDTSAHDTTEYGFDLSVMAEVVSRNRVGIVVDGRYSLNLTKRDDERADHYAILVGMRYLLQDKVPGPR